MFGQVTRTYVSGQKYVGYWKKNLPNGQVTMTDPDGIMYKGEWKQSSIRNTIHATKFFCNITNTANSKNIADCWHSLLHLAFSDDRKDVFYYK